MKPITRKTVLRLFGAACLAACAGPGAFAQDYPTRPIQIIVAFTPGSISDLVTRIAAEKMREHLGQPVVVDNRAGVGGIIGASVVARAKPDGYTILLGSNSTNAINQSLYRSLPYDPAKDLIPISLAGEIPAVLIGRPGFPAGNVDELLRAARKDPGGVRFAVGSTTSRVAAEVMQKTAKIEMITTPYKGEPPGLNDLLGGQVDVMALNLPVAYQYIQAGKVRALGLVGPDRVATVPGVAPIGESLPGYSMPIGWLGFFAPAGTPAPIVDKLNRAIVAALGDKEVRAKMEATGGYVVRSSTPAELAERTRKDAATWAELIKVSGIELQ